MDKLKPDSAQVKGRAVLHLLHLKLDSINLGPRTHEYGQVELSVPGHKVRVVVSH